MINKRLMFFAIMLISLLAISGVSASEINEDISINDDSLAIDAGEIDKGNLESTDLQLDEDKSIIPNDTINNLNYNSSSEVNVFGDSSSEGNFRELSNQIDNAGSYLSLTKDYTFSETDYGLVKGIVIDKSITINGNGHTINGKNLSKIFHVEGNGVKIFNCNFVNCYQRYDWGIAIYWMGSDGSLYNCSFVNCSGQGGGAIDWSAADGSVYNCSFVNCSANYFGGAIVWQGTGPIYDCSFVNCNATLAGAIMINGVDYGSIYNCSFVNCSSSGVRVTGSENELGPSGGGAIYWLDGDAKEFKILNSTFENCSANYLGGAIYSEDNCGFLLNCIFVNCDARFGGAIYNGLNVTNCTFINNSATNGGATYNASVSNCNFTNNKATASGGAVYKGNAINSTFMLNFAKIEGTEDICETSNENCTFIVPTLSISNFISTYDSGDKLVFNLTYEDKIFEGYNITIIVYKDDIEVGTYSGLTGEGWVVNLLPNTYKAILNLENSNVKPVNVSLDIKFTPTTIKSGNFITTYKNDDKLVVTLEDSQGKVISGAILSVSLDGVKNFTTDSNGQIEIFTKDLPANIYDAEITFQGNDFYEGSSTTVIITVNKINTVFSPVFENIDLFVGDTFKIEYELNPVDSVGDISFVSSNPDVVNVKSNGEIEALIEGSSNITITFSGSLNYEATSASVNVVIAKKTTQIIATDITTTYNINKDLIITLKDNEGKPLTGFNVSVDLNGIKNFTTNLNGQIEVSTLDLIPNNYDVSITFEGNEVYAKSSTSIKIIVNKVSVELFAPEVTTTCSINKDLMITLKDCFSNPMSNAKIIVSINDDIKNCTTDSEGMVKISSKDLPASIYNVFIAFFGNEIYAESVITTKFIIKKDPTQLSSSNVVSTYNVNKYLVVNLKDASGHILANKTVTVKVGTISKTLITNAKGQVSVLVSSLVPKTYTATISFAGDSYYDKSSTTASVVVKKATPILTAKAKTFKRSVKTKKYTITFKNNKGVVMKNTKVTLTVNKKTYSVKTNSKGVATFKITNLKKKGKYTAVVKYAGSKYYNKVTKKPKITIKA